MINQLKKIIVYWILDEDFPPGARYQSSGGRLVASVQYER